MNGRLYCVGVGPGDGELMTVKAVRILEQVPVIAAVHTDTNSLSAALTAAAQIIDVSGKRTVLLEIPMTRKTAAVNQAYQAAAKALTAILDQGLDTALITLGDPALYSTAARIMAYISPEQYEVHIVPGVASFCAAAACTGQSLVSRSEVLTVIPAGTDMQKLKKLLERSGTKVIMKPASQLAQVISLLADMQLLPYCTLVQNCGMEGERILRSSDMLLAAESDEQPYFSLFIVRER